MADHLERAAKAGQVLRPELSEATAASTLEALKEIEATRRTFRSAKLGISPVSPERLSESKYFFDESCMWLRKHNPETWRRITGKSHVEGTLVRDEIKYLTSVVEGKS